MGLVKNALLGFVLALVGCAAGQIDSARQGVTVAVGVFAGGVQGLDAADEAVQKDLLGKYKRGELSGPDAQSQYESFGKKYAIAQQALAALWDALRGAANIINAADAKLQADIPGAMAKLAAALANAMNALRDAGVKLPGVL